MTSGGLTPPERGAALAARPAEYKAFVSYRHAEPDRTWARWVVETLERWRTPARLVREHGLPRRLGKAFLDEQELSAGPGLKAEIRRRLEASRFLIVVCSPQARGRPWIEEEVREFVRWGRGARILPLLVAGTPGDALPEALLARGAPADGREPLAADVRAVSGESLRERRRRAALQLLAPILGVDLDTLRRRDDQRRHRRGAVLSVALAVVALALAALAGWALSSNARAQERLIALHEEQGRQLLLGGSPAQALVHLAEAWRRGGTSPALRFLLARASSAGDRAAAVLDHGGAPLYDAAFSPDGTQVATAADDGAVRLWSARDGARLHQLAASGPRCRAVCFSPDGKLVVASGADLAVRIYRVEDGQLEREIRAPAGAQQPAGKLGFLWRAAFVPGTRRFVLVGASRTRLLVDLDGGEPLALPEPPGPPEALTSEPEHYEWSCAVSADGTRIATGDQFGWLRVYDGLGRPVGTTRQASVAPEGRSTLRALAFDPSGERLYCASDEGILSCWGPDGGAALWRTPASGRPGSILAVDVVATGPVATGSEDGFAKLWDRQSGSLVRILDLHGIGVTAVRLDAQGERLLTASLDGRAHLSSVRTGRVLATLEGHVRGINAASLSPAGDLVVTASSDGTARLWPVSRSSGPGGRALRRAGDPSPVLSACGATGSVLLATSDGGFQLFSGRGEPLRSWPTSETGGFTALAADATHMVACGQTGRVHVGTLGDAAAPPRLRAHCQAQAHAVALLPGGRFATADGDGVLRIYAGGGAGAPEEHRASARLYCMASSADGRRLLIGAFDGSVWLWEEGGAGLRRLHHAHREQVVRIALSGDGRTALSAGWDSRAVLWDVEAGREIAVLRGHEGSVSGCALDALGRRAATGGQDGSVCLWNAVTGRLERALSGRDAHRSFARVVFSPDGRLLVSHGQDGMLRVWDAATGRLLSVLEGHAGSVYEAVFCDGGAALVSAAGGGEVWWWDLALEGRTPAQVTEFVERHVPWRLDDEGQLVLRR